MLTPVFKATGLLRYHGTHTHTHKVSTPPLPPPHLFMYLLIYLFYYLSIYLGVFFGVGGLISRIWVGYNKLLWT